MVANGIGPERRHLQEFFQAFEGSDIGDHLADDLLFGEAYGLGLTVVDAEVAKLDRIQEGETDGSILVDGFELCALTLGLLLTLLEGLGEGLAVVDVDGHAKPVEDFAGLVADRLGPDPPPAGTAVAGADHAGFDVVVDAGRATEWFHVLRTRSPVFGLKGAEPSRVSEVFDGEAEVVEEVLVGVGDAAVGRAHPDGLGIEVGEDAVASFAGDESFLVLLACRDVDGEAAKAWSGHH